MRDVWLDNGVVWAAAAAGLPVSASRRLTQRAIAMAGEAGSSRIMLDFRDATLIGNTLALGWHADMLARLKPPGDMHMTHLYDKASPVLAKKCAQGVHFPTVVITSRKSGEGQKDFLKITMKEVFITSVQPAGSSGGDINESVSMSYGNVEFAYKPQDEKGGLGGEVKFGWDVKTTKIT